RLLLERLGLAGTPVQRRKLRILASSASLPASPPSEADRSAKYLWDMFGTLGIEPELLETPDKAQEAWLASIVAGEERAPRYSSDVPPKLDPRPFVRLLEAHARTP